MRKSRPNFFGATCSVLATTLLFGSLTSISLAKDAFKPEDVFRLKYAETAEISPDGKWIAYTVSVQREVTDEPGGRYSELHVVSTETGVSRPFITGKVEVESPRWSPDSRKIAFLFRRDENKMIQIWAISIDGGEAAPITDSKTNVLEFRWHPSGNQIAYVATKPKSKREETLNERGYGFIFYEENLKHRNLYTIEVGGDIKEAEAAQLTEGITIWTFEFSPDGKWIAAGASPENLVDHEYMFSKIHLLNLKSKKLTRFSENPGKLGNFAFSPENKRLVYTASLDQQDHDVSQVFVRPVTKGKVINLTPPDFRGHVQWAGWRDNSTIVYQAAEGVWNTLNTVAATGGKRDVILHSEKESVVFSSPSFTSDFEHLAFTGTWSDVPEDVYYWSPNKPLKRLTVLNPWIAERQLGRQEVITYKARDGWEVEGLLHYPVNYSKRRKYPLIVIVHGGPESHYSYSWETSYSRPVQVLTGKGYAVFLPNYRASTGYGLEHIKLHLGDPAGVEFDDIADGIDHLVDIGLADPDRVGLGGSSYGGYAAAWFSSYYTEKVRAVVMLVGVSDIISKLGTGDIPYEYLFVHFGKKLEEMWQLGLERSPIYHAHKSRTATLILGGTADTRVHPSQSLEYYRRLKMNNHPAVRLVQYPGEKHGNRMLPGRADVLYRTLQWYDWYVRDTKPFEGTMPPLDISDRYGLDLK
ncbi:MAG: S9 family peptidase [Fidelibacterota bacterium]|nr:MAG: S9 family peptidase [Candidatus Neomarinimicrobiota bacterium]